MKRRKMGNVQTGPNAGKTAAKGKEILQEAATEEVQTPVQEQGGGWEPLDRKGTLQVVLFTILLGLAMLLPTVRMSFLLMALALVSLIGKKPLALLRGRVCVPVLGLLFFGVVQGAAAIYSPFDYQAVSEFHKWVAVFGLSVILLARYERRHVLGLLWGASAVSGLIGFISIDGACVNFLFSAYNALLQKLGYTFLDQVEQETGVTRVTGIYNDPNVTACLFAVATLVSLYLLWRSKSTGHKLCASLLLGINAVAFFLCLSRGAIGFFALALLVWLAVMPKGERISLFFLMLLSAVSTLVCSALAIPLLFTSSVLPCVVAVLCGVLIWLLDRFVLRALAGVIERHFRTAAVATAATVVLCVGYLAAALLVTGPMSFQTETRMVRELSLAPGTYTVQADVNLPDQISGFVVEERVTGEWVFLYQGLLTEMTFTVPEDMAGHLLICVQGKPGQTVNRVTLSDGTKLPLRHPLLPWAVEQRFLNTTSKNLEQRLQFDKDAWKLFLQSPLLGHGLGSTERLYTSVQPFYYESKYAHNHILQVMSDTGVVGLVGFLAVLLGSSWLLLRAVHREKDGLSAMLLAAWILMNGHSLMEISFSVRGFACFAFVTLLLPVLLYAKPLIAENSAGRQKAAKYAGLALTVSLALYQLVFGGLLLSHQMVMKEKASYKPLTEVSYLEKVKTFIRRDVFDQEQEKLNFIAYTYAWERDAYKPQAEKYVEDLLEGGTYFACSGLLRYYYLPQARWEELFAVSRQSLAQIASSNDGWNLQLEFYRGTVLPAMGAENIDIFLQGTNDLAAYLEDYNADRMKPVELKEENQQFLALVQQAEELPAEQAWELLMTMSGQVQ